MRSASPECPLEVPANLTHDHMRRPRVLETWSQLNISQATAGMPTHPPNRKGVQNFIFAPSYMRPDGWESAIHASQHPARCTRFLLVEDDMRGSGFGFDAKFLSILLLIAVRQHRVMLHIPAIGTQPYRHWSNTTRLSGRWCDRPPWTYDCMWKPLSHCVAPPNRSADVVPRGRFPWATWDPAADVVRTRISWAYGSKQLWQHTRTYAGLSATRYIFRPRSWVKHLAECVMASKGLVPRQYLSVFLRISPEKAKERGGPLPPVATYTNLTKALASAFGVTRVHVQTANPDSIREYAAMARAMGVEVAYTDNERSVRDTEGGRMQRVAMTHGVVAAVNLHLASQAAISIGLTSSMWTLLMHVMLQPSALEARNDYPYFINTRCHNGSALPLRLIVWEQWLDEWNASAKIRAALKGIKCDELVSASRQTSRVSSRSVT